MKWQDYLKNVRLKLKNTSPPYEYDKPMVVKTFFSKANPRKLSNGMRKIYGVIKEVAMDNLSEAEFISNYKVSGFNFNMADITLIRDRETKELAGFLLAVFYKSNSKGKLTTVCKAFHALKRDYRMKEKGRYSRMELHGKFMRYFWQTYASNPMKSAKEELLKNLYNKKFYQTDKLKNLANQVLEDIKMKGTMRVEIMAENPLTYAEMLDMGLNVDTELPLVHELKKIEKWTESQLFLNSYRRWEKYKGNSIKRSEYIIDTNFFVNTSADEWRKFFKLKNKYCKYYMWQNFGCPNSAITMVIPVDVENILFAGASAAITKINNFGSKVSKITNGKLPFLIGISEDVKMEIRKQIRNAIAEIQEEKKRLPPPRKS
jgi:hypothetical protein